MIGINGYGGVAEEDGQFRFALQCIGQRLGQRMAGFQIQALILLIAPLPKSLDDGFAIFRTGLLFVRPFKLLFPYPGFLFVELGNDNQALLRLWVAIERAFKTASGVILMWSTT